MSYNSEETAQLLQPAKTYKSFKQLSFMVLNITLSSFFFGYCMVYLGSIPTHTLKDVYSITIDDGVTQGILNGCTPVGGLLGALNSGLFIHRFSRRKCLLIMNVIALIVGALIFIPTFPTLVFFRICQGFCIGFYSAIAPLIVKELSPKQIAGTLGSFMQISVCVGVTFSLFFTYILKKIFDDESCKQFWFIVFAFPSLVVLIQTILLLFVFPYETPKYLISQGKQQQAKKLIQLIYLPECVDMIIQQKKKDFTDDSSSKTQSNKKIKDHRIAIVVAIHMALMQQLSGVNAIAVYGGKIASKATTGELQLLMPTLINCLQTLGSVLVSYILSKFGRRIILLLGPLLTGVGCGVVMTGFLIKDDHKSQGQAMILIGLLLFMFFFGVSLGPVVWLYIAQIVQSRIIPFSTATNWISASLVIILFPILTQNLLDGNPGVLFIFFTVWCLASSAFGYFVVIETKDKTQKQIRDQYGQLSICQKKQ